jgi:uncharacterized membrane protein AbrB (regulator of aidB expression)
MTIGLIIGSSCSGMCGQEGRKGNSTTTTRIINVVVMFTGCTKGLGRRSSSGKELMDIHCIVLVGLLLICIIYRT